MIIYDNIAQKLNKLRVLDIISILSFALIPISYYFGEGLAIIISLSILFLCITIKFFLKNKTTIDRFITSIKERIHTLQLIKYRNTIISIVTIAILATLIARYFLNEYYNESKYIIKSKEEWVEDMYSIEALKPYKTSLFLENMQEISNFLHIKESYELLNPDKLINLVDIYFGTVILYRENKCNDNQIRINSKTYLLAFGGHDKNGMIQKLGIEEIAEVFTKDICINILKHHNNDYLLKLLEKLSSVIITDKIPINVKLSIINAENICLKNSIDIIAKSINDKRFNDIIIIRKNFIVKLLLNSYLINSLSLEKQVLYNAYNYYTKCLLNNYIKQNRISDLYSHFYKELRTNDSHLKFILLSKLVQYNNLFLLEEKERIKEIIDQNKRTISLEEFDLLSEQLNFSPQNVDLSELAIELSDYSFKGIKSTDIKTKISFVVPYLMKEKLDNTFMGHEYKIEFHNIESLFEDPIFNFFNDTELNINGLPLSVFSDAVQNISKSTLIQFTFDNFYHPDFEIIDDKVQYKNFEEREAELARKYYPHKERIIKILRNILDNNADKWPFDIKKEDININFISNYLVNYVDENDSSIFHKIYTITNLDSYLKVKNRYLEKIHELHLSDDFQTVRDMIFKRTINNSTEFKTYLLDAINIILKKSIEKRGINKFLWSDNEMTIPRQEKDIQSIIRSHLQPFLEVKGIQISREVVIANGNVDFLCSYTNNGELYKTCIEVKNAHNSNVLHGLTKQLPEYLTDEDTKNGIFIVFWYKCSDFDKPSKFKDIEDLKYFLEQNRPQGLNIDIKIIDCTKKNPPSKV